MDRQLEKQITDLSKEIAEANIKKGFETREAPLDFCGRRGIDIGSHIARKLEYNSTREHKRGKAY